MKQGNQFSSELQLSEQEANKTHGTGGHDTLHASTNGSSSAGVGGRGCSCRGGRDNNLGGQSHGLAASIGGSNVCSVSSILSDRSGVDEGAWDGAGNVAATGAVGHGRPGAIRHRSRADSITAANVALEGEVLIILARAGSLDLGLNVEGVELLADTGEVMGAALGVGEAVKDD